jgi:glycosyltransferase involved in cell wall biosynthesis
MRVAVLWMGWSGYFDACLRALAAQPDVQICLVNAAPSPHAPFDAVDFSWLDGHLVWHGEPPEEDIRHLLKGFRPDVLLVSSWHIGAYRRMCRLWGGSAVRILCMDNQWQETSKQWLGRITREMHIQPFFDMAFVPGDRQATFAKHLGFSDTRILRGLYCCDSAAFRPPECTPRDRAFLFTGRLVETKGVPVLLRAYQLYRERADEPWPLRVAGTGPLGPILAAQEGVEMLGFVQPRDLPALMWRCSSLILPSSFEPWGVVIHEAATAGLVLICSESVGAAVHLLQDGYNGYLTPTGRPPELCSRMEDVAGLDEQSLSLMQSASKRMADQLTPERWATYLLAATAPDVHDLKRRPQ